jgi:hypothetical protein
MRATVRPMVASLAVTLLSLSMTGCHTAPKPADHFEADGVKGSVAVLPHDQVIIDLPSVDVHNGIISISGTVHRKPGVTGELPGRIDIEFLDAEGQYLDGLPALLTPRVVPVDPNSTARYSTNYGYIPPEGSTVRVHFIDHEKQIEEDAEGDDFSYGGNAGKGIEGGYHVNNSNPTHKTSTAHSNSLGGTGGGHW